MKIKASEIKLGTRYQEPRLGMTVEVIEVVSQTDKAITVIVKSVSESSKGYLPFPRSRERKRNDTLLEVTKL
jgi:hypothetical protein